MNIAIVGAGHLGLSIARGLMVHNNSFTHLYLTRRNIQKLNEYSRHHNISITSDNRLATKRSNVLIFAVQPKQLEQILMEIRHELREDHILISTISGFTITRMESIVGKHIIIRVMPNTAAGIGQSMTLMSPNEKGQYHMDIARDIFTTLGKTAVIPEDKMYAATVICASGIAFWMRLMRACMQASVQMGFETEEARELIAQTCKGAACTLLATDSHPEAEIDKVTTPGGCTIIGLNEMENKGMSSAFIQGLLTAFQSIAPVKDTV